MRGKILITPRSVSANGHPALTALEDAGYALVMPSPGAIPCTATLCAALPGCVGWLAGVEPVTPSAIAAADKLRVISRNGTGTDNLPMAELNARGIVVCRALGANAQGVAELALGFTFCGLRNIVRTHEGVRVGEWPRRIGREIGDATVAVVGLGAVGRQFATMCLDLGAQVIGVDPFAPDGIFPHARFRRSNLATALVYADVISLHIPMPEDGAPLISAELLALAKPGLVLVNTARAGLVDEAATCAALDDGRIATYATDVFDVEPAPPSPITQNAGSILTSHIGGFTHASVQRATESAVRNLLEVLA